MDLFEARRLAVSLMHQYGLGAWRLQFDRAKTRSGACLYDRRTISLSAPMVTLMDDGEVRETLLHEIAHALAGPDHGHDETWRRIAQRLGATGSVTLRTSAIPTHDWVGTCPRGHTALRHRRPAHPASCGECARAFDVSALVTWQYKGRDVPMTPAYRAEEAALRAAAGLTASPSLAQGA